MTTMETAKRWHKQSALPGESFREFVRRMRKNEVWEFEPHRIDPKLAEILGDK